MACILQSMRPTTLSVVLTRPSLFGDELQLTRKSLIVIHRKLPAGAVVASSAEPKWKQKLAAADEHAEKTRQATAQAQQEYFKKQAEQRRQQAGPGAVEKLGSMDYISYLTDEGLIADCTKPDVKASVYAIFDEEKTLQYVGVTRQAGGYVLCTFICPVFTCFFSIYAIKTIGEELVRLSKQVYQSMRLHFARFPSKCFYVKVQHLARPSRALLEGIRDQWIAENGSQPPGNDNGEFQILWENPLDCKLMMTDDEKRAHEEAAPGPPKAAVLKNVARRIEKGLMTSFKDRKCTDKLRFDPKLKDRGLLDLKNAAIKPDTSVPTSTPTAKAG